MSHMRKIEQQMVKAINDRTNWCSGNTQVTYEEGNEISRVYLHGNLIASLQGSVLHLYDGGWQTNTTKSRLNAFLSEFGLPNERVYQKNFDWFVRMRDGSSIPFFSSMRLA